MRIEPATADHLRALIRGDDAFTDAFGLQLADGFSSFDGVFEWSLAAIVERGVDPAWSTHLFVDEVEALVVGIGGFKGAPHEGSVEIGYEIAPAHRRRGLATEASRQMIDRARAAGVATVLAHTMEGPNPSTGVLERLGFEHTGTIDHPDDGVIWRWELALDRSSPPRR